MSLPIVDVSGSFREQGRQHGEALAPVIEQIIGEMLKKDTWDAGKIRLLLARIEGNLLRLAPEVVEEMCGIAQGSRLPYMDILAYNALADLWAASACTATGWADTPEGAIVGKTNDIGRDMVKYHHPFRRKSGEGLPAVWATWPGTVWVNCFANGGGLAFGGASLGLKASNPEGMPSNCMLRLFMDRCSTVEDAVALCHETPVMHHPFHAVFADDRGGLVALEHTPMGAHLCQDSGGSVVRATNHFCPGPFKGQDSGTPELVENSRRRFANLQRLADSLPHTVEGMTQLLTDHADSGAICQHDQDTMWSSTAYVAVPKQRRMLIARGQPCEAEFHEFGL